MHKGGLNLGFTLLEVMVVVFMMGIVSTVAVLKLGVGQNLIIESEAKQFSDKLELLIDESILSAKSYRIVIDTQDHGYIFQEFSDKWIEMTDKPFNKYLLNDDMALSVSITSNDADNSQKNESSSSSFERTIIIDTDGVTNDFELLFGDRSEKGSVDTGSNNR